MSIGKNSETSAFDPEIMGRSPYYDDFEPQKKFAKILFKPGLPVQSRELSQVQSILQNQIERFGKHIFENGSVILGGEVSVSSTSFIRLDNTNLISAENLSSIIGQRITDDTERDGSTTLATIIGAFDQPLAADGFTNDPHQVLFIEYNTSGGFTTSQPVLSTTGDNNLGLTFGIATTTTTDASIGTATNFVTVNEGYYFLDGHFVLNDAQQFAAYSSTGGYRNFVEPDASIGFDIVKTTVNANQDASLNDPAFGFNNYNAPGADRFVITPTLVQRGLTGSNADAGGLVIDGTTSDYVELVRVNGGTTVKRVKTADYAELEKTLARRTFDESGNYTVNPFTFVSKDYSDVFSPDDETKFVGVLSPGKAYVNGYEFETIANSNLIFDKARETTNIDRLGIDTPEGSFFEIFDATNTRFHKFDSNTETVADGKPLSIFNSDNEFIGTLNVRMVRPGTTSTSVRIYFFNVRMQTNTSTGELFKLSDARFIQDTSIDNLENPSSTPVVDHTVFGFTAAGDVSIKRLTNNRQIFSLPKGGPIESIAGEDHDSLFTVVKTFAGTADASGNFVVTGGGDNDFFESNILAFAATGSDAATRVSIDLSSPTNPDNDAGTLTLANCGSGARVVATVPMKYKSTVTDQNIRKKTLVRDSEITGVTLANGVGDLGVVDIYEILSITQGGVDVTSKFDFDNGQKIDRYDFGRVILKQGEDVDTTANSLVVTCNKFTHAYGSGGPFTKQSYVDSGLTAGLEFSPDFLDPESGEKIRLFDALDYRPQRLNRAGHFSYGDSTVSGTPDIKTSTVPMVDAVESPFVSYETYLSRVDSVILGSDRSLRVVSGESSFEPAAPTVAEDDLELYRVGIPAFTLSTDDVNASYINNQRYTMSDIGNIEQATFSDNEFNYRTALQNRAIASAVGLFPGSEAFDDGVFADDLIGHGNSDVTKIQHNVSIDPITNTIRPAFTTKPMGVSYDATQSANLSRFVSPYGEIITSRHTTGNITFVSNTDIDPITQGITVDVNRFGVTDYLGSVKLDPFCDRYWSDTQKAKVIVNTSGENNAWKKGISAPSGVEGKKFGFGTQWKDWESIWFGREIEEENITQQSDPDFRSYVVAPRSTYVRRNLSQKITRQLANKIIDLSIVPYMRAVTIDGTVEGMRPNSTAYLYFDDELTGTTTGYSVGTTGAFTFSLSIPTDTYLTGEKVVRVMDNADNNLNLATTSADAIFYATGALDTNEAGVNTFRPLIRRRDSSSSNSTLNAEYTDLVGSESAPVLNALTPVSQTFTVDQSTFPDGMVLKNIKVLFSEKPDDSGGVIKCEIRPVDTFGYPRRNYLMPCSEVYLRPEDVNTYNPGDTLNDKLTTFNFCETGTPGTGSPIYLSPGTYSVSFSSNDINYKLWTVNKVFTQGNGGALQRLFQPSNTGQVTELFDYSLSLVMERAAFEESNSLLDYNFTSVTADLVFNTSYVASSKQLISSNKLEASLPPIGGVGFGPVNATRRFENQFGTSPTSVRFRWTPTDRSSNIIDTAQVMPLLISNKVSFVDANEVTLNTLSNDNLSSSISRYYSKIVTLPAPAANLNVRIKGKFPSGVVTKVFGKFKGTDSSGSLDQQPYVELVSPSTVISTVNTNGDVETVINNFAAPIADGSAVSDTGLFTEYQLKLVLSNNTNRKDLPEIASIDAVPLGRKSEAQFFQTIVPSGSIFPYAGTFTAPEGFLLCDGTIYNKDEFLNLYNALGGENNPYNTDSGIDSATQFQVPNLQGRMPVGEDRSVTPSGDAGFGGANKVLGNTGGITGVAMHQHTGLISPRAGRGAGNDPPNPDGRRLPFMVTCDTQNCIQDEIQGLEGSDARFRPDSLEQTIDAFDITVLPTSATGGRATTNFPGTNSFLEQGDLVTGAKGNIVDNQPTAITLEQMPPYVVTRYIIKI